MDSPPFGRSGMLATLTVKYVKHEKALGINLKQPVTFTRCFAFPAKVGAIYIVKLQKCNHIWIN